MTKPKHAVFSYTINQRYSPQRDSTGKSVTAVFNPDNASIKAQQQLLTANIESSPIYSAN